MWCFLHLSRSLVVVRLFVHHGHCMLPCRCIMGIACCHADASWDCMLPCRCMGPGQPISMVMQFDTTAPPCSTSCVTVLLLLLLLLLWLYNIIIIVYSTSLLYTTASIHAWCHLGTTRRRRRDVRRRISTEIIASCPKDGYA